MGIVKAFNNIIEKLTNTYQQVKDVNPSPDEEFEENKDSLLSKDLLHKEKQQISNVTAISNDLQPKKMSKEIWNFDSLHTVYSNMNNKILGSRLLHVLEWAQNRGALDVAETKYPTLGLKGKNGKRFMSFWPEKGHENPGHIYCYLDNNHFENEAEKGKYIERLNELSIFNYDAKENIKSGRDSEASLDLLSENEFDLFITILADYCFEKPSSNKNRHSDLKKNPENILWISSDKDNTTLDLNIAIDNSQSVIMRLYQDGSVWSDIEGISPKIAIMLAESLSKIGLKIDIKNTFNWLKEGKTYYLHNNDVDDIIKQLKPVLKSVLPFMNKDINSIIQNWQGALTTVINEKKPEKIYGIDLKGNQKNDSTSNLKNQLTVTQDKKDRSEKEEETIEDFLYVNKENKKVIIEELGEKFYNFFAKDLERTFVFSRLLDAAIAEFNKTSNIETDFISNRINETKTLLGEDFVVWALKDYRGIKSLIKLLRSYELHYEIKKSKMEKLKSLVDRINPNMQNAKIKPLVNAVFPQTENIRLLDLFEKYNFRFVKDLNKIELLASNEVKKSDDIVFFLNWLSEDKKELIRNRLNNMLNNDREKYVVDKRAEEYTLEKIGASLKITRERVRQIEKKVQIRFNNYVARYKPHLIIYAFSDNVGYISAEDIEKVFSNELSEVFIYCLKNTFYSSVKWCDKLNGFIMGDTKWHEDLLEIIEIMPDILDQESFQNQINKIYNKINIPIAASDLKRIVLTEYSQNGNVYSKNKMSKTEMYYITLKKYYPNGIKLYEERETSRFRQYVKHEFGNVELPENNRAIDARLADIMVLCDRGKYVLPDAINISQNLIDEIKDAINNEHERNTILFSELFERFKDKLFLQSNITNRFFLQGVLKYYLSDEFTFIKDGIVKEINLVSGLSNKVESGFRFDIERFIKKKSHAVTKDELRNSFSGTTEANLSMAISNNERIIAWEFGEYIHTSSLKIEDAHRNKLRNIIDYNLPNGITTSGKLFDVMSIRAADFIRKNNIRSHYSLFSILEYLFAEEFEFNRPYIGYKGVDLSFNGFINSYTNSLDSFNIFDLVNYCKSMHIKLSNITQLIADMGEEFLRVDTDTCISKNRIFISDEIISIIERQTMKHLGEKGYASIRTIESFNNYPEIGPKWTPFLLESIINNYSKKLKIIDMDLTNYRILSGVIVEKASGLGSYEDLLKHAIKTEHQVVSFRNEEQVKNWLKEKELILKNELPDFLKKSEFLNSNGIIAN